MKKILICLFCLFSLAACGLHVDRIRDKNIEMDREKQFQQTQRTFDIIDKMANSLSDPQFRNYISNSISDFSKDEFLRDLADLDISMLIVKKFELDQLKRKFIMETQPMFDDLLAQIHGVNQAQGYGAVQAYDAIASQIAIMKAKGYIEPGQADALIADVKERLFTMVTNNEVNQQVRENLGFRLGMFKQKDRYFSGVSGVSRINPLTGKEEQFRAKPVKSGGKEKEEGWMEKLKKARQNRKE
ncbi:MAG: hypothetical protein QG618_1554 [Thermodesulfobacteriota bacterium]|nr:hypothetical protein [Thermodesulfobacteriota bacterium]